MTRRSDALMALVAEVVDIDRELVQAEAEAEEARQEATAARAELDARNQAVAAISSRRLLTRNALDLVAGRDQVSDETLTALLTRARR